MSGVFQFKTAAHAKPRPERERQRPVPVAPLRGPLPQNISLKQALHGWRTPTVIAVSVLVLLLVPTLLNQNKLKGAQTRMARQIQSQSNNTTLAYLNRQLQEAQSRAELASSQVEAENFEMAPRIRDSDIRDWADPNRFGPGQGLDYRHDRAADRVYEDIARSRPEARLDNFDDRLSAVLANRQFMADYDKRLRAEYIRQVTENALRAGYDIKLNDQLEVIAVRRRDKPELAQREPQAVWDQDGQGLHSGPPSGSR